MANSGKGGKSNRPGWNKTHKYEPKNFSKVTPKYPIIKKIDGLTLALYSNYPNEKAAFDLFKFTYNGYYDRTLDYIKSFSVETTLNSSEKGNMKFEYKVNKTFLEDNNYKDIKLKTRKNKKFFTITGGVISSDESTVSKTVKQHQKIF